MIFTEDDLQKQVASYLHAALPDGSFFHHSPNEGNRHVAFKVKLKAMGFRSGFPDLVIFCPETLTVFIELKRPGTRTHLRFSQKLMRDQIQNLGFHWAVCTSLDEVREFLKPIVCLKENGLNFSIKKGRKE